MLVFDQLNKNDPSLRWLATVTAIGLGILLAGLWWVQVVCGREYQSRLEVQSFRTVRVPAVRGKILDRNGEAIADSRPSFNASLYLEELRKPFSAAASAALGAVRTNRALQKEELRRQLGRKLTKEEEKRFGIPLPERNAIFGAARYQVASNLVSELGRRMGEPLRLDPEDFRKRYAEQLILPLPLMTGMSPMQMTRFEEQIRQLDGVDLDVQPTRYYPYHDLAAHLLGQLRRDVSSAEGEDAFLNYPLPVVRGVVGIEAAFDGRLRGRSGSKSVLVNNVGYRQAENVWTVALPGDNVVLTIDRRIQEAAEIALSKAMNNVRGAVVVMDPRNGDILAMASAPSYDVNLFTRSYTHAEWAYLNDPKQRPQINRAVQENYAPGSIFKIIVGLAALDAGLNPNALYQVQPDPANPGKGCIFIGREKKRDTAPPGPYNFHRALLRSSNAYFVTNGLRAGIDNIIRLSRRVHLGERCGIPTGQEVRGILPTDQMLRSGWSVGDTANLCIGQGKLAVTPVQMAVMTAAVANGGRVFFPRLVADIVPQDAFGPGRRESYPAGRLRDNLGVRPSSLRIVREAMLADTEDTEGTAFKAFHETSSGGPRLKTFRVAAKTGTAEVENQAGRTTDHITWFVSFAPFDNPRYVVVVMVESGGSGGSTCAPVSRDIYQFLEEMERQAMEQKTRVVSGEWKRDADRDSSGPVLAEARTPVGGPHDILQAIQ